MNFVSLFSGIGGFDLGFEQAGLRCVQQVEIDDKARAVLARHWPGVDRSITDVRDANRHTLATADVFCGGFPCQDVSVAGRRAGLAGERSGLWFEFHRILQECRPRWVVIENVPGLLSSNGGADFGVILAGLVECGYGVAWRVLDAQYFGVAQRRRRVFIVGHLGDGRAAQVLFERQSLPGNPAAGREAGTGVAALTANGVGTCGADDNQAQAGHLVAFGGNNTQGAIDVTTAVNAAPTRRYDFESETLVVYGFTTYETPKWRQNLALTLTVPSPTGGGQPPAVAFTERTRAEGRTLEAQNELAYALTNPGSGGRTHSRQIIDRRQVVRRLTPTECERLQSFPDGWTAGQSDSTRYRQLGNAICVAHAAWLGRRLTLHPPAAAAGREAGE